VELKLQVAKEAEERLKSHQGMRLNHYGKAVLNNASSGMQESLASISDGIKSSSEENEVLRCESMRLKEQLVDAGLDPASIARAVHQAIDRAAAAPSPAPAAAARHAAGVA
jgi:hypothetical protein